MTNLRLERFRASAGLMRCPLCHSPLEARERSLACPSGHAFDISKKGTVNFIPQQRPLEGYDACFFEHRSTILEAGFYDHVADALRKALQERALPCRVLDVGCGEGFYAKSLQAPKTEVYAFDISKEAIEIAARGSHRACFFVADLANIPMQDGTVDFIANVFTPAHYAEFTRVLSDEGILAKVVPGPRHLHELRERFAGQLRSKDYSNERVVSHFQESFDLISRVPVCKTVKTDPALIADFVRMTPLLFHVEESLASSCRLEEITVDAEILIGRPVRKRPTHAHADRSSVTIAPSI